jgi:hypothetical protein
MLWLPQKKYVCISFKEPVVKFVELSTGLF